MNSARLLRESEFYEGASEYERLVRRRALLHRLRLMLRGEGQINLEEVADAHVPEVRRQLLELSRRIATAHRAQWSRIQRLQRSSRDDSLILALPGTPGAGRTRERLYRSYRHFRGVTPLVARERFVASIVWTACAIDETLMTSTSGRLERLVDRRLRIAERMLYDVGDVPTELRSWTSATRRRGNFPWEDGLMRMFEYPRVRAQAARGAFVRACDAAPATGTDRTRDCRGAGMEQWFVTADGRTVSGPMHLNGPVSDAWRFEYVSSGAPNAFRYNPNGSRSPEYAISDLFWPFPNFEARNHIFCDHVIHAILLESLRYSRRATPNWLPSPLPIGWLQLGFSSSGNDVEAFWNDNRFFQHRSVESIGLQVGDWLAVSGHPAHRHSAEQVVFATENALVIQTTPVVLLQGHGTQPQTVDSMVTSMLRAFNRNLEDLRRRVDEHLRSGRAPHEIPIARGDVLVPFAVDSATPDPRNPRSWHLRWTADAFDLSDSEQRRRRIVEQRQFVRYEQQPVARGPEFGFFPLYRVRPGRGERHRHAPPMHCDRHMVAPWHLLAETPARADWINVVRPHEPP